MICSQSCHEESIVTPYRSGQATRSISIPAVPFGPSRGPTWIVLCALLLLLQLFSFVACAQGPYVASANFSADLYGKADTRPDTWGFADSATWPLTFKPPAGKRVRILKVSGDLTAFAIGKVPEGTEVGVLFGLQSTAPEASVRGDWMADNTFVYIQDIVREPRRAPFHVKQKQGFLLEPDHILVVKVASWLNTTGRKIHIEPTFTIVYRFD